jgi:hypothetical protein
MPADRENEERQGPEKLLHRLTVQRRNHVLWDALLVFSPPWVATIFLVIQLFRAAWIGPTGGLLTIAIAAIVGLLAVLFRYRPLIPSVTSAARWVDQHAGAQDRFLTLATVEASQSVPALVSRLRTEATEFQRRIELKRDFPYHVKRSFYWSLLGSLVAALLFYLLLPAGGSSARRVSGPEQLRQLAAKMAQRPGLSELARGLQSLATKLEEPKSPPQEKQSLIQEMEEKVGEQQRNPQQKENKDLLGQASSTLQGLEQQSGSGQNQRDEQDKGGGGIQANLPQEGQGEGKQSQGGGGDSKNDQSAQLGKETDQTKSTQGASQDQGQESNRQKSGEGKGNQPNPNKPDTSKTTEAAGKTAGNSAESGGKNKPSEEIPRGAPPAERFNPAGEQGREGIKGAHYVTVQLPEELTADAKGESTGKREGGRDGKARPKLPVSNVPLPAHVPEAPTEKQPMPLEYRGMIR